MKHFRKSILFAIACMLISLSVHAQMSDEQVIQYVKEAHAAGKIRKKWDANFCLVESPVPKWNVSNSVTKQAKTVTRLLRAIPIPNVEHVRLPPVLLKHQFQS